MRSADSAPTYTQYVAVGFEGVPTIAVEGPPRVAEVAGRFAGAPGAVFGVAGFAVPVAGPALWAWRAVAIAKPPIRAADQVRTGIRRNCPHPCSRRIIFPSRIPESSSGVGKLTAMVAFTRIRFSTVRSFRHERIVRSAPRHEDRAHRILRRRRSISVRAGQSGGADGERRQGRSDRPIGPSAR